MSTTKVIEVSEGREVTEAAIACNLGSGLMDALKIAPRMWKAGDYIDVAVRMRVGGVEHKPVHKDDFEGPYRRIHKAKAVAVTPTTDSTVAGLLDSHIAEVSKAREIPGQGSVVDEINELDKRRRSKKSSAPPADKPKRTRKPRAPKGE